LINLYRKLTPELRTEDEHPLLMRDLATIRESFESVETRFFHLMSMAAVPFRRMPGFEALVKGLDGVDRVIFALLPPVRRYAWMVVLQMRPGRIADRAGRGPTAEG
jgi:hypothetical protein